MERILKHVNLILFLIVLVFAFTACDAGGNENSTLGKVTPSNSEKSHVKKPVEEKIKIGFSMDTLLEERWLKDRNLFKKAVESLGAEVEILAANGDDSVQIAQAETLISQGVDLLVVVPHNAEAMAAIVKRHI